MEIVEMFGATMPAKRCGAMICGQRGAVEIKGARMVCKLLKFLILPLSTLFSPPLRAGRRAAGKVGEKFGGEKRHEK